MLRKTDQALNNEIKQMKHRMEIVEKKSTFGEHVRKEMDWNKFSLKVEKMI